jgi:hypothetical protein
MEEILLCNRPEHNRLCSIFVQDSEICDSVNKWMDEPSQWLGSIHRSERHSYKTIHEYAKLSSDVKEYTKKMVAGLLHLSLDYFSDRSKKLCRIV